MIEKDLYSALLTVCERVSPIFMPQDSIKPAIVYQVIYDGTEQSVKGDICGRNTRIQIDIYSDSYGEAKSLKEEVINKIVELKGGDIAAQDLFDDDEQLFRQLIDFKIKE